MQHFVFRLKQGSSADEALVELDPFFSDLYEIDDPENASVQIGGYTDQTQIPNEWTHVILESADDVEEIDWQQQWSTYAPGFHHGLAHVDLSRFGGQTMILKPGSGFGDFSHPTTRLCLELMAPLVKEKTVIDIGCGSGILSIAARLLGAKQALGIDIDEKAIEHSQMNALLNDQEERLHFSKHIEPSFLIDEIYIIVMNMISSEQQNAWSSAELLHSKKAYIITSGILESQKKEYLQMTKAWNWRLKEERQSEGWAAFLFTQNI